MAKASIAQTELLDKPPRIHVTRNGELYVKPEDVVKSKKFAEQVEKLAKIRVTRGPAAPQI